MPRSRRSSDAPLPVRRARRRAARVALALVLGCGAVLSAPASARAGEADRTQIARDLFERGKARWAAGQYEEAAALLAASNQQTPKAGTSMLLADAYEHLGRLRTARDTFRLASELARASGESQLEYRANTREAALLPRLPQVEIRALPPVPPGLLVTLNGRELQPSELNAPTALDAGSYLLEARAPGYEAFSVRLELSNDAPQAGVRVVSLHLAPRGGASAASEADARERLAWWVGGAGGVLALASVVTLIVALDANGRSKDECGLAANAALDDEDACSPRGLELRNRARTLANVAGVAGALGVVGLGAGLTLHFTAPSAQAGGAAWLGYGAPF